MTTPQEFITMQQYKIAVIPADGIGKEVIPAGVQVLETLAQTDGTFVFNFETFPWGSDYYHQYGKMMPKDGLDTLKDFDAIFFGAVGYPTVPDHISLWGLRLAICQGFDQYANVRPARILPGIISPLRGRGEKDLDWIIIRENSEGEYAGVGGRAHRGHSHEVGMEVSVFTRSGVQQIMRYRLRTFPTTLA
jgi:tartrate dehydrogenase/decarboxylase/D-malate dehydrogenase